MKKQALKIALAAAMVLPAAYANAAGDSGVINFTGQITEQTCSLGNSANINVPLGSYTVNHLTSTTRSEPREIRIQLTGCDADKVAKFTFTGQRQSGNAAQLRLNSAGGAEAKNVAVGISTRADDLTTSRVQFDGTTALDVQVFEDSDTTILLYGFYEKLGDATDLVTAGPANTSANFEVTYM